MVLITLLSTFTLFATTTRADEISVVDVKRNITLKDEDPVYKDFFLNAGEGSALKKNMVVTVKRKINIKDSAAKSVGDFDTVVGQLKIIHVGNKVSVAREYKLIPRDDEPMLEQVGIMTGDVVDLTDSFIDTKKSKNAQAPTLTEPTNHTADQFDLNLPRI